MSPLADLLPAFPLTIWLVLLAAGGTIGLLSGLLGIGGGVIAVPVLLEVFATLGLPWDRSVAMAVGTAQTNILLASLTAVSTHWRAGTIDGGLVRAWLPAVLAGTAAGLAVGAVVPAAVLTTTFAVAALCLAVKLGLGDRLVLAQGLPRGLAGQLPPVLVGTLAASVGVGGGTLSTPVLSLFSYPVQRAVGAGALFNLVIALPATGFFLVHDQGADGRTADAVGDVSVTCLLALSLPALAIAPLAAGWSTRVPAVLLRRLFALCLAVVAARLLLRN